MVMRLIVTEIWVSASSLVLLYGTAKQPQGKHEQHGRSGLETSLFSVEAAVRAGVVGSEGVAVITPFPTPMMMTAWATGPGKEWESGSIGGGLIQKCQAQKFKTVGLQISQCTKQHVDWCRQGGLFVVGWDHPGRFTNAEFADRGFDGFMPQIESPDQLVGALRYLEEGVGAGKPKAVITTFFGFDDGHGAQHWADLTGQGVSACFVECYASDGASHADLDRMRAQAVIYGIPSSAFVPVCGVYRGELPPQYQGIKDVGREFGCYIAETMSDDQWKAWGATNVTTTTAQVYYWRVVAGASILHQERAITYPDGTDGLGKTLDWMKGHKDLVRTAKAVEIVRVLA
jgi:hypothetical protein